MNKLEFCSVTNKRALENWFENCVPIEARLSKEKEDTVLVVGVDRDGFPLASFMDFLEDILLRNNPAINDLPNICRVIKEGFGVEFKKNMALEVERYFNQNTAMNLEGFVNFRLGAYAHTINVVLYSIAKKSLENYDMY